MIAVVVLTLVFGLVYPLLFTGFAQLAFADKANGSLDRARRQGRRLEARRAGVHEAAVLPSAPVGDGSRVQRRRDDVRQPRSRRTPTSRRRCRQRALAILKLERPYNPGLTIGDIPVDAVTTSASGIDPHISPANAQLQTARVAKVRGLSVERVAAADRREHRRALARDLRRAGRERARAQPRARRGDRSDQGEAGHLLARHRRSPRSATRSSSSTRARSSATRSSSSSRSAA